MIYIIYMYSYMDAEIGGASPHHPQYTPIPHCLIPHALIPHPPEIPPPPPNFFLNTCINTYIKTATLAKFIICIHCSYHTIHVSLYINKN